MTSNGDMPLFCNQGASLVSRNRTFTSGVQIALQPCGGDVSAFPIAASNAPQLFHSTSGYQGNVNPSRQRFHVELMEGETNAVSWKKLVKDAQENASTFPSETAVKVNPSLVAPPTKLVTSKGVFPVPTNRISSVIEKIERLYQGVDSEEEDGYASMDDSHYDSEDSFIDDTELDEYFRVDTAKTKHTGFCVSNRKLEKVYESPPRPPLRPLPPLVHVQKKRKRNITTHSSEIVAGEFSKKRVKISLGLNHTTSKTPGPLTTAVKATSVLVKTSEQLVMPKPKKRVSKPILSGRHSHEENTSRLSSHYTWRENVGDSGEIEEDKVAGTKIQTTAVEVSDNENDQVEGCRPMVDTSSRGGSDIAVQKSIETLPATSDLRETQRFPSLPKTRNKEKLLNGDELKQPSMGNDSKFCTHVTFSVGNKEIATQKVASWPKGALLERAFHDLEKAVSEAFPHTTRYRQVAMEKSTSGEKSKKLPREVKQKLAKVAHVAANRDKIPDEIIERLTNLIGHIMKPKTLKRILESMVKMGLKADQGKDVQPQAKKRETTKLQNSRVVTFLASDAEQLDGSSDDLRENQGSIDKGRFKRDAITEDRIGDRYDHHLEGVDEHNIPQITEFFTGLPDVRADVLLHESKESHEVQNAVCRSKERRKKQEKVKMGEEKCRKKITDKHVETDRETPLLARKFTAPLRPTIVPLLNKGVPQNEKQIMKSSEDGQDDTSKNKGKPNQDAASGINISLEAARKILVDLGTRHRMEYAKKMRLALPKALQSESRTTSQDQK